MIIGITGTLGSGKGTVAEFLERKGFTHYSVREFLTEEVRRRGLIVNRENLVLVGNELRKQYGPSHIAEKLYERAEKTGGDAVIESIRTQGEIEALRTKERFVLFAIDAPPQIRYARVNERKSVTDHVSYEEFITQEEQEMHSTDPTKQNLAACIKEADHLIKNDGTITKLHERIASILGTRTKNKEEHTRPNWDEYFMEITRAVATRGTCDRGKSGCVIARDKQILVTGYVGSPKGMPHCSDIGHQMEEWEHSDGIKRWHCVRTTHAEQNAICQAAKIGVSIEGATLYCKMTPCSVCAGMIINAGIKRVVCEKVYQSGKTVEFFKQAGVKLEVLNDEIETYGEIREEQRQNNGGNTKESIQNNDESMGMIREVSEREMKHKEIEENDDNEEEKIEQKMNEEKKRYDDNEGEKEKEKPVGNNTDYGMKREEKSVVYGSDYS